MLSPIETQMVADAGHAASLHAFAVTSTAVSSVFVATALTDAYAKAGRLALALSVLDEMPSKNVVSWTTLVGALTRAGHRHGHDALRRFAEMRASGVPCDSHACAAALTACAEAKLGVHATPYAVKLDVDGVVAAVGLFGPRAVAAWTTVISSYVQSGRVPWRPSRRSSQCFMTRHQRRQRPTTAHTLLLSWRAAARASRRKRVRQCPLSGQLTRHALRTRRGSSLGS
jgi:pentatricopeptide repeat protein